MKIYLAGGMTVMNCKGRERELSIKFDKWQRLFSFYFMDLEKSLPEWPWGFKKKSMGGFKL